MQKLGNPSNHRDSIYEAPPPPFLKLHLSNLLPKESWESRQAVQSTTELAVSVCSFLFKLISVGPEPDLLI